MGAAEAEGGRARCRAAGAGDAARRRRHLLDMLCRVAFFGCSCYRVLLICLSSLPSEALRTVRDPRACCSNVRLCIYKI